MKHITLQLNTIDGNIQSLPIYTPEFSYGEDVYIRIVTGNTYPNNIYLTFNSSYGTEKVYLREIKPSIWESKLNMNIFKEVLSHNESYSLDIYAEINNTIYKTSTDKCIAMIGTSLGTYHNTEISDLYDKVNSLYARIYSKI